MKQAQWQVFHDYLGRAERLLADATAIDPTDAAAWTQRVTVARGLSLDVEESKRRYAKAAEHCDIPFTAQASLVQNLCPKWGGTEKDLLAFARECRDSTPPGTLGGAVVAHALVECAFNLANYRQTKAYLQETWVLNEVITAAQHTVLHPSFRAGTHGEVAAHSVFAYALFVGGDYQRMGAHFEALGDRANEYPWKVYFGKWQEVFRAARKAAGVR